MSNEAAAARLRTALELYEVGEAMMRQRLRRERPDAEEAEIDLSIQTWLNKREGAEFGDYPGPASSRPMRPR